MLIDFFFTLKDAKIPVSIKEFLILLEAMHVLFVLEQRAVQRRHDRLRILAT